MSRTYIGKLPPHWKKNKVGGVYRERTIKVSDKDFPPLSVTKNGVVSQLETVAKTNDNDNRKLVKRNDFVINSRSDRRGSCGISNLDGSVSLINTVLEPLNSNKYCNNYYDWFFHTENFADEFYKWGHGIVDDLWTTRWLDMKNIEIPYPPLEEQKKIADFLDGKCAQIDEITQELEKKISKLEKYKKQLIRESVLRGLDSSTKLIDSGIDWIGLIPSHWKLIPNKYLFKETTKKVGKNWEDYQLLSLTTSGVKEKDVNAIGGKMPDNYEKYLIIHKDQLIFCLFDLDVSAVFSGISKFDGMITSAYNAYDTTSLIDKKYADYFFQFIFINRTYKIYSKNLRYTISSDGFNSIKTLVPPLEEQKKIADFLDGKCAQIDEITQATRQEIEKLKQYKQSLIYEYVTGKKEVSCNE